MTIDRRVLGGALAVLLLVAACGGSASQAPTSEPGATTPAGTEEPSETQEATERPEDTLNPGAAADLEAMLPSEVNGITFEKASFDGSTVPGGIPLGEGDDDFTKFLEDNGKSLRDVKVAIASPTDTEAGGSFVMAIQVQGVPSDKLLEWAMQSSSEMEKTTIAGKEVYGSGAAGFGAYIYPKGDVVFYVLSFGGEDLVDGIISALP
jgi:hypothetical protein